MLPLPEDVEGEEDLSSSSVGGLEGECSQGSSITGHKQILLAAALQALHCHGKCVVEEFGSALPPLFGSALPSLLPPVGIGAREEVQALCKAVHATAAPPLWFLWCLIKHLVYFEAI